MFYELRAERTVAIAVKDIKKMRLIKFRAKTIETRKWVYGYLNVNSKGDTIISNEFSFWFVDPKTVGEFTGLLDKNGKEIYEGDIIEENSWVGKRINTVIYRNDLVGFGTPDGRNYISLSDGDTSPKPKFIVIGNIYENPELLNES